LGAANHILACNPIDVVEIAGLEVFAFLDHKVAGPAAGRIAGPTNPLEFKTPSYVRDS